MLPTGSTDPAHEAMRQDMTLIHTFTADTPTEASAIFHELTGGSHRSHYRGPEGSEDGINPFTPLKGPNPWDLLESALQLLDDLAISLEAHTLCNTPIPADAYQKARSRMDDLLNDYFYNESSHEPRQNS